MKMEMCIRDRGKPVEKYISVQYASGTGTASGGYVQFKRCGGCRAVCGLQSTGGSRIDDHTCNITVSYTHLDVYKRQVGGCIRDSLLSRTPNDWDITTSALPEQVKALFPHTIDTGIKHGTVTVMCHHVGYRCV